MSPVFSKNILNSDQGTKDKGQIRYGNHPQRNDKNRLSFVLTCLYTFEKGAPI